MGRPARGATPATGSTQISARGGRVDPGVAFHRDEFYDLAVVMPRYTRQRVLHARTSLSRSGFVRCGGGTVGRINRFGRGK